MQVVVIISQIKVNCMTVVRLKSIDTHGLLDQSGEHPFQSGIRMTSNVEQVLVFLFTSFLCTIFVSSLIHFFACAVVTDM